MKIFRILKSKEKYITTYEVINKNIFIIQEFKRGCFGLGRKEWRNYQAESYDVWSVVYFYDEKEAINYLNKLKNYYNKKRT